LINEDALRDFLQREGFTVVIPGELPFADQVKLFAQAGVIVGIHGAGLTNLLWAPPGCTVIELAPAGLRDVGYRFSSHLCGHLFSTVLCRALEHPRGLAYSDIEVDVDAVRAALAG
jgi:capsular polysaccharide biosynthesis protein